MVEKPSIATSSLQHFREDLRLTCCFAITQFGDCPLQFISRRRICHFRMGGGGGGRCLALLSSLSLIWLTMLRRLVKCLRHRSCCCWGVLQVRPSSSLTFAVLMGTRPLFPHWISRMHFHTTFPPFIPPCASVALRENQLFFASLMAFWASLRAFLNFSLSDAGIASAEPLVVCCVALLEQWTYGRCTFPKPVCLSSLLSANGCFSCLTKS